MKTFNEWLEKFQDKNNLHGRVLSDREFVEDVFERLTNIPMLRERLLAAKEDKVMYERALKLIEKALYKYTEKYAKGEEWNERLRRFMPLSPLNSYDNEMIYAIRDLITVDFGEDWRAAFEKYH